MSYATVTLGGKVTAIEGVEGQITKVRFQPDLEHSPELTISGYGEVGGKLQQLLDSPCVITGQIKHLPAKNTFTIEVFDCWVTSPFGKVQAGVAITGRYSDRYAEEKDGRWTFNVSYPSGLKKEDGKKEYFNWKVTAFGKTAENIRKYFKDGESIGIPQGALQWYGNGDKLYLSVAARSFSFVGGRTND